MTTKRKSKPAAQAVESAMMRSMRIDGSHNGATLHTRVVKDKTKYTRNLKHKKSLVCAGDFPFYAPFFVSCGSRRILRSESALKS